MQSSQKVEDRVNGRDTKYTPHLTCQQTFSDTLSPVIRYQSRQFSTPAAVPDESKYWLDNHTGLEQAVFYFVPLTTFC